MEWAEDFADTVLNLYALLNGSLLSGFLLGTALTMLLHVYKLTRKLGALERKPIINKIKLMHPHFMTSSSLDESTDGKEAFQGDTKFRKFASVPFEL